jgi:hypothetical protein
LVPAGRPKAVPACERLSELLSASDRHPSSYRIREGLATTPEAILQLALAGC